MQLRHRRFNKKTEHTWNESSKKIEQKDWEKRRNTGKYGTMPGHGPGTEYELYSRDEALSHVKVKDKQISSSQRICCPGQSEFYKNRERTSHQGSQSD